SGAGRVLMCSGIRGVGTSTTETVELAGDTHLIEIRIAGERKQAGLLCLPAETADTQCIAGFGYRNRSEGSTLRDWLRRDVVLQCLVGNCFNETVADSARRDAECFDGFRRADVLDDVGIRRAGVNQLAARCVNKCAVRNVTGSEFHFLTEP